MDSVTHIFLGGAIALTVAAKPLGNPRAFLIGALAATFPDFDVFLRVGNDITNTALHRHFMHSLIMVPVLAALSVLPFMLHKKSRPLLKPLFLTALLACVSHTLLDTLTSYGTMIFWPFTFHRYALDVIPVIDPLYTLPLILGVFFAWKYKSLYPALAALGISMLYLGLAAIQHSRAQAAQARILAVRHVLAPINPRVLPQAGAVISYRSIYIDGNQIHADAIHVPLFSAPTFKPGGSVTLLNAGDLQSPATADAAQNFNTFAGLADGYLARSPTDRQLIADERYTYTPEGLDSVWGIQLENTSVPLFRITPRYSYFGKLARDLFRPTGYSALPPATP